VSSGGVNALFLRWHLVHIDWFSICDVFSQFVAPFAGLRGGLRCGVRPVSTFPVGATWFTSVRRGVTGLGA
jgi:hypothetical protein